MPAGNDVFAKGRAIHAARQAAASSAAPQATTPTPKVSGMQPPSDFPGLAKQFGADKLQLHPNPVIGKAQLATHLHSTLGPDYMKHPDVPKLMDAYQAHTSGQAPKAAVAVKPAKTLKALVG